MGQTTVEVALIGSAPEKVKVDSTMTVKDLLVKMGISTSRIKVRASKDKRKFDPMTLTSKIAGYKEFLIVGNVRGSY